MVFAFDVAVSTRIQTRSPFSDGHSFPREAIPGASGLAVTAESR